MSNAKNRDRAKLRRLEVLARVSRVINSALEPTKVLDLVLGEAVRVMRATSGSIVLINPHTQLLEIEVAIGLGPKARQIQLPIGKGVTGWVAKHGRPLRVADVTTDPRYIPVRRGVRSELAVPLSVGDQLIGVLNVDSTRRGAFTADDEELLVALASNAAEVIHHSWLYAAVASKARQLESLHAIAQSIIASLDVQEILERVTREGARLMDSKVCSLMLLNAAEDRLELRACHGAGSDYTRRPPLSVADSLIGVVVRRRKPLQVYNVQEHDRYQAIELARKEGLVSLLAVPMVSGDRVIGALNVYSGQPYRYSDQDIAILAGLANLAAIAIENARLHEKIVTVEEQLRHKERLSALGLLAAEVAHEIRNPLTVMKMLFHSLDLQFPAGDPRAQDVAVLAEKMDHLNQIVDRILRFARSAEPTLEEVNLNDLLADVLLLTRRALADKAVALRTEFASALPVARVDRAQIEQVCLNLILNALDAMPDGGTLTVTTTAEEGRVRLSFADTGTGMTADQQRQLFEPFLTTKTRGTGLGLAIVRKIIEAHHGQIAVESAPGQGTIFHVQLPL